MAKGYVFTESEAREYKQLLQWWRSHQRNAAPSVQEDGREGPTVYVARVPSAGIPPLTEETGTGGDSPGSATCDIYRIQPNGKLQSMGITRKVYNISTDWIEKTYTIVQRLRSGRWVAEGDDSPDDYGTGTGTGTGTGDSCVTALDGVTLSNLAVDSSPLYALGIDSTGCLVLIPIGSC